MKCNGKALKSVTDKWM